MGRIPLKKRVRCFIPRIGEPNWRRIIQLIKSRLVKIDLAALKETCVLLTAYTPPYTKLNDKLLAWFPERELVAVVSNILLPPKYVPLASCAGLVCGMHIDNVYNFGGGEESEFGDWLSLMVCNPATGFQKRLPLVQIISNLSPGEAHMYGEVEVVMTPPTHGQGGDDKNGFTVHLVNRYNSENRLYKVYTFRSGTEAWECSANSGTLTSHVAGDILFLERKLEAYDVNTRTWTSLSFEPGSAWTKVPLPQEFLDCSYRRLDAFRYGSKIMVAGECYGKVSKDAATVVLELQQGESPAWKIVASVSSYKFHNYGHILPLPAYDNQKALVGGNLLVFPFSSHRCRPCAFHLEHGTWLEIPAALSLLPLQSACIYNPTG